MTMNDDIKKFPVYALSNQGLVPIELSGTDGYNHYTHQLHHFIKQQSYKGNKEWYDKHGIEQKLILMPIWVHNEIHGLKYTDEELENQLATCGKQMEFSDEEGYFNSFLCTIDFKECDKCCNKHNPRLDDWIKPFVDSVNERFKQNGN